MLCPNQAAPPMTNSNAQPMVSLGMRQAKIAKGSSANMPKPPAKNCMTCAFTVPAKRRVIIENTATATAL